MSSYDSSVTVDYCRCRIYNSIGLCDSCQYDFEYDENILKYCNLPPSLLHLKCKLIHPFTMNVINYKLRITNLPYYLLSIYNDDCLKIILKGCTAVRNYKLYYVVYWAADDSIKSYSRFINNYNYVEIGSANKYIKLLLGMVSYLSMTLHTIETFICDPLNAMDYYPQSLTIIHTTVLMRTICDNLPVKLVSNIANIMMHDYYDTITNDRICPKIVSNSASARNLPVFYEQICGMHHRTTPYRYAKASSMVL